MGKITPGVKAVLVIIAFLGFTNSILSETKFNLSEIIKENFFSVKIDNQIFSENSISEETTVGSKTPVKSKNIPKKKPSKSSLANPSITLGTDPKVCKGSTIASLSYSNPSENPNQYSINFNSAAITEGFLNITNASLPSSPIQITVPNGSPGTYNAILTVTNGSQTSENISFSVIIKPIPVAVTKDITIQLAPSGNVSIAEDAVNNNSTDSCGGLTFTTNKTTFTCANVGSNTVTLTVTDTNGNSDSTTAIVTVEDNVAPVAIAQNVTVTLDASGNGVITAVLVDDGSNDTCGIATLVLNKTAFTCADIAANPNNVTLTVTDNNENVSTATANITVVDNIAPVAITKNITVQLNSSGNASIAENAIDNNSTDSCGGLTFTTDNTTFTCANVGSNTVTLTVTDTNGNSESTTAIVTVEDNVAPVAITKNITVQLNSSGNVSIAENAVDNNSTDSCGGLTFNTDKTSFTCANVGANTVTLTVTDTNGNTDSKTAIVTVEDNVAPIAITKNITVNLDASGNVSIAENAVDNNSTDSCGGLTFTTDNTTFTCANVGSNTVTLTVTDTNGNSESTTAIVTVEDNVAPVAITKNITVQLNSSGNVSIAENAVDNNSTDSCGGLTFNTDKTSFTCANVGANTVTLTVTDTNGNTDSKTAIVTVEDNVAPIAITKNITVNLDASGNVSIAENAVDNNSTDSCGGLTFTTDNTTFTCANVGSNTVTLTVTDTNGNSESTTAIVTVEDNVAPVAIAQNVTVTLDASGNGVTTAVLVDHGSNDACGIASLVLNKTAFTCADIAANPNNVNLTVTDNNGNVSTATANVTVVDNVAPVAITKNITINLDASGNVSIAENAVDNNSTDSCGGLTFNTNKTSFNCSNVGNNTVNLTVTDKNDNFATVTAVVTVQDNIIPVIAAVSAIDTNTDTGLCKANLTITAPLVSDNCSVTSPTGTRSDNKALSDPYPTGETMITWTAIDANNNAAEPVTQKITAKDNEAPIVPVLNNITWGCNYTVVVPVAMDNCDNEITGTANRSNTFNSSGEIIWTFTDAAGNDSTVNQIITINPLSVSIQKQDIVCFDAANGIAEAIVSGGVAPFTYDWGASGNTSSISGLIPRDYNITVTDANGCSASSATTITQPAILNALVASTNVTCNGSNDGSISISNPSGGFGTYQYSIDNGTSWKDSGNFSSLSNGNYQVLLRDKGQTECSIILDSNLEITQPDILAADVDFTNITCNDQNDGTITVSNFAGGYGTYEFSKNNGNSWQGSSEFSNLSEGFYTVLIRDKENPACILNVVTNLEITRPSPLNGDISNVNISCFGLTDGSIIISNPSGGYGNFEFSLDSSNWQQEANFENLSPGIFTVYIRDADNSACVITLSSSVEITQPELLISSIVSKTDVLCNGQATGEVTASASGGTAPYTFSWGSLGQGATKTNLPAGTYAVTVTDTNGCETEPLEVVITEPDTFIDITNVYTTTGCYQQNNGTATVEATGGTGSYTYLWSNGQTTQLATGLAPGNHTVTITDENGCSKDRTVTVSAPTELKITGFLTTETTSFGTATGTATAQVTGGTPNYTFSWSGLGSNNQTGQSAKDLPAGTYTVTATDSNGCTASDEVTIIDALDLDILPTSICEDEENLIRTSYFEVENLTARGGTPPYNYEWDFGDASTPSTASGTGTHRVVYSVIGDKAISVKVTDANGLTFTENIIQYVGGCFSNDCGSSDLQTSDYFIGDSNGNEITNTNCANALQKYLYVNIPTNPKRYSLNIEYIYSVKNIETEEIENFKEIGCFYEQKDIPDVAQTIPIDYECGDIVKIEGIYFTFSNRKNDKCGEGPQPKCYSTNNEATVTSPLYAVAFPNELLCNGADNGIINSRASGGTENYTFKLISSEDNSTVRTAQTSGSFLELPAGKFKVVVSDGSDSFTTVQIEITQPTTPLDLSLNSLIDVTCFGGAEGSATVQASGGTPNSTGDPYIYVWSNGQTSTTATNLIAGDYTVRVIDANGCETQMTVTIEQPEQLLAVAGPDQVLVCGLTSTSLQAQFDYEFAEGEEELFGKWSIVNGPAGGSFEDDNNPITLFSGSQGTYTLRWNVPCGASDDVKVSFSNCNTIDFDGKDDHIVFGDNFNLTGDFTIEAWIKQDPGKTAGIKTIVSKRDASDLSAGFDLIIDNNIPKFRSNNSTLASQYPISTDRWYHISVINGGTNPGLYVDGILVSEDSPLVPTNLAHPFLIGAMYDSNTSLTPVNYFHGWIEEVRIWNTAITKEQLHFMMNQKLQDIGGKVQGLEIPIDVPGDLDWDSLLGYYQLEISENGLTPGKVTGSPAGKMINITTTQQRTAPLPYLSTKAGQWHEDATWLRPLVWDPPHSMGIDGNTTIDWNIARISHNISSGGKNIKLLGLHSNSEKLTIANSNEALNENNSGQSLTLTHYLKLNGVIDLVGESQLIQTDISTLGQSIISILDESSTGFLERDQQGTANSYNYNYWSSPVSARGAANNSAYTVAGVKKDGTNSNTTNHPNLNFGAWHEFADGSYSSPRKISNYWLYKFRGTSNVYSEWEHIGSTGILNAGEGYTMKGTSGNAKISDRQNYVFKGKPNNGTIKLNIGKDQNYLLGNPYPSALDINKFIKDNLRDVTDGKNTQNIFNGAVYFWDHFAGKTHILAEYIGGYATRNLLDGVPAVSNDERINANDSTGIKIPGQFIPVAQGFFINSVLDPNLSGNYTVDGGDVIFQNSQRVFVKETNPVNSQFLKPENNSQKDKQEDTRAKIRLDFKSPMGYNRQILVGADPNTTNGFDLGYDAPLNDNNLEDMFWLINGNEFVIQGVPNFEIDQVLPLGIKLEEEGVFSIKINKLENISEDVNIHLKNLEDSTYFDLRKGNFTMKLEPGTYNERFQIVFQKEKIPTEEPDPDEETEEEEQEQGSDEGSGEDEFVDGNIEVFYMGNHRELAVLNPHRYEIERIVIYDMLGQIIQEYQNVSNEEEVWLPVRLFPAAVYAIKLFSGNKEISKSIILIR